MRIFHPYIEQRPQLSPAVLEEIKQALRNNVGSLAENLLGPRNKAKSTRSEWRWNPSGSFSVKVSGAKRGACVDFASDWKGDPLALIMRERNCGFAEAITWAAAWAGITDGPRPHHELRRTAAQQKAEDAEHAADVARRAAEARAIWDRAAPITGTLAERYLTEARGIPAPDNGWPECLRATNNALIVAATDDTGTVQGIQRVFITAEARNAKDDQGKSVKRSLGPFSDTGAVVRLPGATDGPLLLAEGPETGLSVWRATGHETWIAVGSISNFRPPQGRRVVVCRDDDQIHSPADKTLRRYLDEWRKSGVNVAVATPWPKLRGDKSDFNDTIREGGIEAVRARIDQALSPEHYRIKRLPIEEARAVLADGINTFFAEAEQHREGAKPHVHAIRTDVGTGKSIAARRSSAQMLHRMRERGDDRNIVIAVPAHKLGDEQAEHFNNMPEAKGLRAEIWRGRDAPDPHHPDYADPTIERDRKAKMCMDPEAIRDAHAALADPQSDVCFKRGKKLKDGTQEPDRECPFFRQCAYQRQRERKADVWFVAHESLYLEKPKAIGEPALVVVDESAWQDGLKGHDGSHLKIALDNLAGVEDAPVWFTGADREQLRELRHRLWKAIKDLPDGPIPRAAILDSGLAAENIAEANILEWARKIKPSLRPGMPAHRRKEILKEVQSNRTIPRMSMLWKAMEALLRDDAPEASGWAAMANADTKNGTVRVIRLKGRSSVGASLSEVPTLIVDAILQERLIKYFWPSVELTADIRARAPFQTIRQVVDRSYSKAHLRKQDNFRDVHAIICREARMVAPERYLAVIQKEFEEAFIAKGNLPENLELAHHNDIAGRDIWGPGEGRNGVAGAACVGRTAPSPASVERHTEALTGAAIAPIEGWYPRADAAIEMADGAFRPAMADRHPDQIAEAVRWQIMEGELVQFIGRPRGVNRTAANPVNILLMTDVPLPVPIDEVIAAKDIEPSVGDLMMASGGAAFANPGHAAEAYPDLWPSREAAKKAFERGGWGQTRISNYLYGNVPNLALFQYQRAGSGQSKALCWIDTYLITNPRGWLEGRLGPLAIFESAAAPTLPPISACVNATLAMPTLNASVEVLALPEPANEPVEVLPWNGLTPAQQAAAAELVEQWRGDDLFLVFDEPLPPLPRNQRIAVQPSRAYAAMAMPGFDAPANADPVAPCIEGVCGEGLDPSAVFAGDHDMAIATGVWRLSGNGIRTVEEWRRAPLLLPPEAQAAL